MYRLHIYFTWIVAQCIKRTGFRFGKDWRLGVRWYQRAFYRVCCTYTANLMADGASINSWLPKSRGRIMRTANKNELIEALKEIRHTMNCALLYKQAQKMLTIQKTMNKPGYDIRIKERGMRSKPIYCETPERIVNCIAHYYGDNKRHDKDNCPFCDEE